MRILAMLLSLCLTFLIGLIPMYGVQWVVEKLGLQGNLISIIGLFWLALLYGYFCAARLFKFFYIKLTGNG